MELEDVFDILRRTDAVLHVEDGKLKYTGPRLDPDHPLRDGIDRHRATLIELFTYGPEGRCAAPDCYRLRIGGADRCPGHADTAPALPNGGGCRNSNSDHLKAQGAQRDDGGCLDGLTED